MAQVTHSRVTCRRIFEDRSPRPRLALPLVMTPPHFGLVAPKQNHVRKENPYKSGKRDYRELGLLGRRARILWSARDDDDGRNRRVYSRFGADSRSLQRPRNVFDLELCDLQSIREFPRTIASLRVVLPVASSLVHDASRRVGFSVRHCNAKTYAQAAIY